jgi:hypothetical protein
MRNALSGLIKFSFRFERFFPQFIKIFLSRQLAKYRKDGVIHDFKVDAVWRSKYHYFFTFNLSMGEKEVETWLKKRRDA